MLRGEVGLWAEALRFLAVLVGVLAAWLLDVGARARLCFCFGYGAEITAQGPGGVL